MSSSRPLDFKIPQELWTGRKPDYAKLRIFGCEAYALVPKDERRKLESRSRKCIFLGYGPDGNFGYRLWDPETRQVIRSADVVFNESAMHKSAERPIELRRVTFSDATPLDGPAHHTRSTSRSADSQEPSTVAAATTEGAEHIRNPRGSSATSYPANTVEEIAAAQSAPAPEPASPVLPRRSERLTQPPERYSPGLFFTDSGEPTTYKEAINATDVAEWQLAMESEMRSIRENDTWDLVKLPKNLRALPCRWVFRLK